MNEASPDPRPRPDQGALGDALGASLEGWLARLAQGGEIGRLLRRSLEEQEERGYLHTLREICQQPVTWLGTAATSTRRVSVFEAALEAAEVPNGRGCLVLTGSGSSLFAGECLAPSLQEALRVTVRALPAGHLLTHPRGCLPPSGPYLVISLGRSGNSPESRAVVDSLLETEPASQHLIITCNRDGALASRYNGAPRVRVLVLDDATNDRSLVMTSSYTNMVLAGRALGSTRDLARYRARAEVLAREAAALLLSSGGDALARRAGGFRSAVYLGSGCRLGSAREAALKMLEMSAGEVPTMAESYLGLRHGPMSAVHDDTLLVCFLSSDPTTRAYEIDLLEEVARKGLGGGRVLVGSGVPADVARKGDVVFDVPGRLEDADLTLIDALVGQLLAFFRCLGLGLRPDAPSARGVISRVVEGFAIHRREGS